MRRVSRLGLLAWLYLAQETLALGTTRPQRGAAGGARPNGHSLSAKSSPVQQRFEQPPPRRRLHSTDDDDSYLSENCTLGYATPLAITEKILACENPEYRPVHNVSTTVSVRANIEFFHIDEVNTVDGTATFNAWFRSFWVDEFMTWNPDHYGGIDFVTVDRDSMWLPDFVLYNSAEIPWYETIQPTRPWVYSDGYVWDSVPAQLKVTCNFEFQMFPHDTQTCDLTFGSWIYDGNEMDLDFADESIDGIPPVQANDNFYHSTEWQVLGVSTTRTVEYYAGIPFPLITFHVTLRRYAEWYVTNGVIPMAFGTFVTFGSFWLDAVQQGERVGLCITALLTITAVHLSITTDVPRSRYSTWLDRFMVGCFTFSFFSTMTTLFVIYLALKKDREIQNKTLKKLHVASLSFHKTPSKLFRRTQSETSKGMMEMQEKRDSDIGVQNPVRGLPGARASDDAIPEDATWVNVQESLSWQAVARSIDRFARFMFPIACGIFLAIRFAELYKDGR